MRYILSFSVALLLCLPAAGYAQSKANSRPDPNVFVELDRQPAPLNMAQVASKVTYPKALKDKGITGKVYVKLLVSKNGRVKDHVVVKTPHEDLAAHVVEAAYLIRFSPGVLEGEPVAAWVMVPFDFQLPKSQD